MTITRREYLKMFAGAIAAAGVTPAAGAIVRARVIQSSTDLQSARRIDTHHHVFPPPYIAALTAGKQDAQIAKAWSVARTLDDMGRAGVETSILSVTQPAVTFAPPDVARRVARESNEWVAKLVADNRGRFGSFATLPITTPITTPLTTPLTTPVPDVDGALREVEYALDTLKADGVCLLTSYGDRWLGHASFAPLLDELNRRKAVVYTHPATADCCRNLLPGVPDTVIEFGTDTSRTITDIVFSGTANRCRDAQFIFSHAGGTLPYLTERLVRLPVQNQAMQARVPRGVLTELKRFFYDTAWSAHPMALASLTRLVPTSQVLFGSDYPYRTGEDHVKGLMEYGFTAADRRAIDRDNALRLLPRLSEVPAFAWATAGLAEALRA
jgi:predicted TIM-barrel fold metal-dependent hydrolase